MQSLWSQTTELPKRETLTGDMQVQNVVIGAGMAGILTAYFLKKQGREVMILEAKEIGSGQTKNTTAKITSQTEKEKLQQEARTAKMLGIDASFVEGNAITELPFSVIGAVCFENQAQFHPLDFIRHLSEELEIYENTRVLSVKGHTVFTNRGTVTAQHIIFATHYPLANVPGFYFLRQNQSRSYVLALEGEGVPDKLSGIYYSMDKNGLSFRSAKGSLLLGGGSHRAGKNWTSRQKTCKSNQENGKADGGNGFTKLRNMAENYYPDAKETADWSAQDCMPHDGIPFIGKYSVFRPYWYVATGFQKWGMTSSMISAIIISNQICGRENPYQKVFSPQRFLIRAGFVNFCVDVWESIAGLTKGFFGKKEKRCSHMGCHLYWNEEEKVWECACHGSRFDEKGNVLDNPAKKRKLLE